MKICLYAGIIPLRTRRIKRCENDGREDADDGDNDEEFYEGEA